MMLEPAFYLPPYGTPIDGIDFGEAVFCSPIGSGITMSSGVSTAVARIVAEVTGDLIRWPFHTIGFLDAAPRTFVLVIHCGAGSPREAELSISHEGLRLNRSILRACVQRLFVDAKQHGVIVRVRPDDVRLQRALTRLGFINSGRDDAPGAHTRLIFTIDAATAWRRAFPRGGAHS